MREGRVYGFSLMNEASSILKGDSKRMTDRKKCQTKRRQSVGDESVEEVQRCQSKVQRKREVRVAPA